MTQAHRWILKWARIIHVYLTMFGFVLLFFFAVTGFMLNHEDWFLPRQSTMGKIPTELLIEPEHREAIIDKLRNDFDVQGDIKSFDVVSERNAYRVVFASEDGSSEAIIQRDDGETQVTSDSGKTRERITIMEGVMPRDLLAPDDRSKDLPIVEHLRKEYAVRGEADFKYEKESESFRVVFKAPGYLATATIRGSDGQTRVTHQTRGIVGLCLDLHRGKDSGLGWSVIIDGVSILFVIVSVTGLILWSSLRGRAQHGLAVLSLGVIISLVVYFLYVPR